MRCNVAAWIASIHDNTWRNLQLAFRGALGFAFAVVLAFAPGVGNNFTRNSYVSLTVMLVIERTLGGTMGVAARSFSGAITFLAMWLLPIAISSLTNLVPATFSSPVLILGGSLWTFAVSFMLQFAPMSPSAKKISIMLISQSIIQQMTRGLMESKESLAWNAVYNSVGVGLGGALAIASLLLPYPELAAYRAGRQMLALQRALSDAHAAMLLQLFPPKEQEADHMGLVSMFGVSQVRHATELLGSNVPARLSEKEWEHLGLFSISDHDFQRKDLVAESQMRELRVARLWLVALEKACSNPSSHSLTHSKTWREAAEPLSASVFAVSEAIVEAQLVLNKRIFPEGRFFVLWNRWGLWWSGSDIDALIEAKEHIKAQLVKVKTDVDKLQQMQAAHQSGPPACSSGISPPESGRVSADEVYLLRDNMLLSSIGYASSVIRTLDLFICRMETKPSFRRHKMWLRSTTSALAHGSSWLKERMVLDAHMQQSLRVAIAMTLAYLDVLISGLAQQILPASLSWNVNYKVAFHTAMLIAGTKPQQGGTIKASFLRVSGAVLGVFIPSMLLSIALTFELNRLDANDLEAGFELSSNAWVYSLVVGFVFIFVCKFLQFSDGPAAYAFKIATMTSTSIFVNYSFLSSNRTDLKYRYLLFIPTVVDVIHAAFIVSLVELLVFPKSGQALALSALRKSLLNLSGILKEAIKSGQELPDNDKDVDSNTATRAEEMKRILTRFTRILSMPHGDLHRPASAAAPPEARAPSDGRQGTECSTGIRGGHGASGSLLSGASSIGALEESDRPRTEEPQVAPPDGHANPLALSMQIITLSQADTRSSSIVSTAGMSTASGVESNPWFTEIFFLIYKAEKQLSLLKSKVAGLGSDLNYGAYLTPPSYFFEVHQALEQLLDWLLLYVSIFHSGTRQFLGLPGRTIGIAIEQGRLLSALLDQLDGVFLAMATNWRIFTNPAFPIEMSAPPAEILQEYRRDGTTVASIGQTVDDRAELLDNALKDYSSIVHHAGKGLYDPMDGPAFSVTISAAQNINAIMTRLVKALFRLRNCFIANQMQMHPQYSSMEFHLTDYIVERHRAVHEGSGNQQANETQQFLPDDPDAPFAAADEQPSPQGRRASAAGLAAAGSASKLPTSVRDCPTFWQADLEHQENSDFDSSGKPHITGVNDGRLS